ncbi:hypothetical protein ACVW00_002833 [Marmoricola sp. URHA0025 HA25]
MVMIDRAAGDAIAAPRPWDGARSDQPGLVLGQATGQRGQCEQRHADHEHASTTQVVGQASAEEQEAAEGQRVGVHHPGQVGLGEVERLADRGQRDVDDRGIDDHDELGHREQRQREVARPRRTEVWLGHEGSPGQYPEPKFHFRL